jgi:ABC-type bacteriocin/lantibiotic exporter with double-glycine peptidase domain
MSQDNLPNKRVSTPTVQQMEAVECGAAALSIIMGYFGKWRPLEEIRVECGVSRDGSKAKNILLGARHYGFEAKGRKASLASALRGDFPFIVFWKFNHFLVVEGVKNDVIYLNDPAVGRRTVSHEEFDNSFTGVILDVRPGKNFTKEPKPAGLVSRLVKRTRAVQSSILLAVFVSLTMVVPGIVVPGLRAFAQ